MGAPEEFYDFECYEKGKTASDKSEVSVAEALEIAKSHSIYISSPDGGGSTVITGKDSAGQGVFLDAPSCPVNQLLQTCLAFN